MQIAFNVATFWTRIPEQGWKRGGFCTLDMFFKGAKTCYWITVRKSLTVSLIEILNYSWQYTRIPYSKVSDEPMTTIQVTNKVHRPLHHNHHSLAMLTRS